MAHRNRWFSQLETTIYKGFSMAMLVITREYNLPRYYIFMIPCRTEKVDFSQIKILKKNNQKHNHQKTTRQEESPEKKKNQKKTKKNKLRTNPRFTIPMVFGKHPHWNFFPYKPSSSDRGIFVSENKLYPRSFCYLNRESDEPTLDLGNLGHIFQRNPDDFANWADDFMHLFGGTIPSFAERAIHQQYQGNPTRFHVIPAIMDYQRVSILLWYFTPRLGLCSLWRFLDATSFLGEPIANKSSVCGKIITL